MIITLVNNSPKGLLEAPREPSVKGPIHTFCILQYESCVMSRSWLTDDMLKKKLYRCGQQSF